MQFAMATATPFASTLLEGMNVTASQDFNPSEQKESFLINDGKLILPMVTKNFCQNGDLRSKEPSGKGNPSVRDIPVSI